MYIGMGREFSVRGSCRSLLLRGSSPVASRLLTLLAFLNFDDIFDLFGIEDTSKGAIETSVNAGGPRCQLPLLSDSALDRYAVESAFAGLQTYSLVPWRVDQGVYTAHKLVHAWACHRLSIDQERVLSLTALELLADVVRS